MTQGNGLWCGMELAYLALVTVNNETTKGKEMKIECTMENAAKLAEWLKAGRGLALWRSADLGNPGKTWTTPARNVDGTPMQPQHWSMEKVPALIVESASDVTVFKDKEVKRFKVGLKRGYGFQIVCTDAASRRIKKAVSDAGNGAYHTFDYDTQEAVIMQPESSVTLAEWLHHKQTTDGEARHESIRSGASDTRNKQLVQTRLGLCEPR